MVRILKELFEKHRQHFLTVAFVFGFIVDNLTLTRVDQLFDNVILLTYVALAMGSLLILYAGSAGKFPEKMNHAVRKYAPLVTQYAFGGLFFRHAHILWPQWIVDGELAVLAHYPRSNLGQ